MSQSSFIEEKSFSLHQKAWSDTDNWEQHLNDALELFRNDDISLESMSLVAKNNYAAILLDLNYSKQAFDFLRADILHLQEGYANMAIAVAKTDPNNIDQIREFNSRSQELSTTEYAITAYMDWMGL